MRPIFRRSMAEHSQVDSMAFAQKPPNQTKASNYFEWVEENWVAKGDNAPNGKEDEWMEIPPACHLPFTKQALNQKLLENLPSHIDARAVKDCLKLVDLIGHATAFQTLEELKADFFLFEPSTPAPELQEEELKKREVRFLTNFLYTLIRGNFVPMSEEEYRKAADQRFVLDVPVRVRWERMDGAPITRFLDYIDSPAGEKHREELDVGNNLRDFLDLPAEFNEKAMIFYRGIEPIRTDGWFTMAKVDLLVTKIVKLITFPISYPLERWLDSRAQPARKTKKATVEDIPSHRKRLWLRRLGLESESVFAILRKSYLQEPALKEVVVLFRPFGTPEKSLLQRFRKKNEEEKKPRDTIHVKMFKDIPLSDAEIVFPENAPMMRTLDAVLLTVTAILAVPAVYRASTLGSGAMVAAAIVLGTYVSKVVGQYFRARQQRAARISQELYQKTRNNDVGVLQYLVDAGEEQDYKEVALVYVFLLIEGKALTEEETDQGIEKFVARHFSGLDVEFEIPDALNKAVNGVNALKLLRRIEQDGEVRYYARDPNEVYTELQAKWFALSKRSTTEA